MLLQFRLKLTRLGESVVLVLAAELQRLYQLPLTLGFIILAHFRL